MNARQKGKIDMFFGGLASKYENSADFFVGLSWTAVSGRKEYRGRAFLRGDKFVYSFAGTREYGDIRACLPIFARSFCNTTVRSSNILNAVTVAALS